MKKFTYVMSLLLTLFATSTSAQVLNRSTWTITVSGEQASDGGGKDAIIDGNNSTYWHSCWGDSLPQFFQIDLGSEQDFNTLGYMPRPDRLNGTVYDYKLYVSDTPFENVSSDKSTADIVNALGTADIESSFDYSNDGNETKLKTFTFPKMLRGRYVLFVTTKAKGSNYASCAEFYLAKDDDNNPPFIAQDTFDANTAHWYALTLNGIDGNYLLSNNGGSIVSTTTVNLYNHPDVLEDAYLWAFEGNLKDGYKIYSKVDHKSLALYNQLILKKGNGSVFRPYKKALGFGLYVDEGKLLTLESEGEIIASSEHNDSERSTFRVLDSKLYVTSYARPFINALYNSGAPENAIWGVSYLNDPAYRAKYRTIFLAASADDATNEQIAALGAENVKIAKSEGYDGTIEEGKFYRLYNGRGWLNINLDAGNTSTMYCNINADKTVASVVNFENDVMKIKGLSLGYVSISAVGNRFNFLGSYTDGNSCRGGYLGYYGIKVSFDCDKNNSSAQWYVVPATEAEIAMTEVNGRFYTSAYLPFPINGISGADAYVGKLNDEKDMLNMTQVQGVTKNTGFVLVGKSNKAKLSIGETTETTTSDLRGNNTNIVLNSTTTDLHEDYLVFGVNDGNVGFYAPSYYLETIPANKAYLETNLLATKAIVMNFGGNITSLSHATVIANENAPIYDLSGRRVAKAFKGGVYIQNGKKFVK